MTTSCNSGLRAAFLVAPHAGGIFTVYNALRSGLRVHGVSLDWLGLGDFPSHVYDDPRYREFLDCGHFIPTGGKSVSDNAADALNYIQSQNHKVVFVNALSTPLEMSLAAFLPPAVRRIGIVHNITPGTYSAAKAIQPYVHFGVGVSPRIEEDLVGRCGYPADYAKTVANALDLAPYADLARPPRSSVLRILSLGRVVDVDKGVFWLPEILRQVKNHSFHLTVAGDGPDLAELQRRCEVLGDRVTFIGRVAPAEVPKIMASHDVLLMPSRFEGFGYTLIEAMAARCVPVATSLRGVSDFVVKNNRTGLLFPVGDVKAAASAIQRLAVDRSLLDTLGDAGRTDVFTRFSVEQMAEGYFDIIQKVLENPRRISPPPTRDFQLLPIGGGWRKYVPKSLKNRLRNWLYRS